MTRTLACLLSEKDKAWKEELQVQARRKEKINYFLVALVTGSGETFPVAFSFKRKTIIDTLDFLTYTRDLYEQEFKQTGVIPVYTLDGYKGNFSWFNVEIGRAMCKALLMGRYFIGYKDIDEINARYTAIREGVKRNEIRNINEGSIGGTSSLPESKGSASLGETSRDNPPRRKGTSPCRRTIV